jgi:MinD-like ATPase involved in chromosome partitioning or flagellar assembly
MGVVVFCSGKSAGVTTLALATAARWPQPGAALLVEADPAGGDLAARFGLRPAPGLTSAAAAGGGAGRLPGGHVQQLPGVGVAVLLAAASYLQASAAVRTADEARLIESAGSAGPVLVDVGRLDGRSPALPIAARAAVVVLVCAPRWDELAHAAASLEALRAAGDAAPWLVLRGDGAVGAKEIADALDVTVCGVLPEDRAGARVLSGQARPGKGWVRLPLARTARGLAIALDRELHPVTPPPPVLTGRRR